MISMTPTLTRGYTFWDRALLPPDEFEERVRLVQEQMRGDGLAGLLILSNTYHCSGDLAYLAGWPIGGVLLTLPQGEPRMYTFGGGREIFFQKAQIWLASMQSLGARFGAGLRREFEAQGVTAGKIGVVGLDLVPSDVHEQVMIALDGYEIHAYDAKYQALREPKRVREILAIEVALRVADKARQAAKARFEQDGSVSAALVAAERAARLEGALDYRGLANTTGQGLRPFEVSVRGRQDRLMLWSAVNVHGYWADLSLDTGAAGPAHACVDAMIEAVRAGASADAIAQAGLSRLPQAAWAEALSHGLGGGIGQELHERPVIAPGNQAVLKTGAILSLRAYAPGKDGGSLAGALVRVGENAAERLIA